MSIGQTFAFQLIASLLMFQATLLWWPQEIILWILFILVGKFSKQNISEIENSQLDTSQLDVHVNLRCHYCGNERGYVNNEKYISQNLENGELEYYEVTDNCPKGKIYNEKSCICKRMFKSRFQEL